MMFYVARCKRAGFTLIEIMIVIAIIAILAGIAIPNIREARAEAQLSACRQNILVIVQALDMMTMHTTRDKFLRAIGTSYASPTSRPDSGKIINYLIEYGYLSKEPICTVLGTPYDICPTTTSISQYKEFGFSFMVTCSSSVLQGRHRIGGKSVIPRYYSGGKYAGWRDFGI